MADGSPEAAAARDDRIANHARSAGLSEAGGRGVPAAARRQAALPYRNLEVPQAVRAASSATAPAAEKRTRGQGRSCRCTGGGRSAGKGRKREKGKSRDRGCSTG